MEPQRRQLHADRALHALVALIASTVVLTTPLRLFAQTSVEVSPLRVELKAAAGGSTTQAITLTNSGKDPVRIRATISDWHLSRDGSPQFVEAADAKFSASAWTRIAPPEMVVEAGRQVTVRFTLTVPADAPPAGYRTGILFEFGPPDGVAAAKPREVTFRSRIATLIYANVGEPPAAVELTDLSPRLLKDQPPQIVAVLKNTSVRTVRTRGTMTLFDKNGTAVRTLPVPDVPVLPESEREVAIAAADPAGPPLGPGEYRVEVKIDVGLPALLVGETTLKVS